MEVKKILWPTDCSKNTADALSYVTSLTEKYQAEVHVLYVMEPLQSEEPGYEELDWSHVDKISKWEEKVGKRKLDEICNRYLYACPRYIKHIAVGHPAQEILRFIKEERIGMVVMAKHGPKGHFRVGSVSRKVMEKSPVLVVTIPIGSKKQSKKTRA